MFVVSRRPYTPGVASTPASRSRSTRDRPAKPPLSEAAIVAAAIEVLRAEGLEAVSMRRVAKELDTGAASLYAYVKNRDDLYDLIFDEISGQVPRPEIDPERWRAQLRQLLLDTRASLLDHPGLAKVALARIPVGGNAIRMADTLLGLLLAAGVPPQRAAWACDILFLIVTADAVENDIERELAEQGSSKAFDLGKLKAAFHALPSDEFPYVSAHAEELTTGDGDVRFAFAIDTFIDGLLVP